MDEFVTASSPEQGLLLALIDRLDKLEERIVNTHQELDSRLEDALDPLKTLSPHIFVSGGRKTTGCTLNARDNRLEVYMAILEAMRWGHKDCRVTIDNPGIVETLRLNGFAVGRYSDEDHAMYSHVICWKGELESSRTIERRELDRTKSDELREDTNNLYLQDFKSRYPRLNWD